MARSRSPVAEGCSPTIVFVPSHCWRVADHHDPPHDCHSDHLLSLGVAPEQYWWTPPAGVYVEDHASDHGGACERDRGATVGAAAVVAVGAGAEVRESSYFVTNGSSLDILYNETRVVMGLGVQNARTTVEYVQRQWTSGRCEDAVFVVGLPVVPFEPSRAPPLPRSRPIP